LMCVAGVLVAADSSVCESALTHRMYV